MLLGTVTDATWFGRGVTAVLMVSSLMFEVMRYASVVYFAYFGMTAWRLNEAVVEICKHRLAPPMSTIKLFRVGFLISISNPKAAAYLPQFIDQAAPRIPQI